MPPSAVRRSTSRSRSWRKPDRCGSAPGSRPSSARRPRSAGSRAPARVGAAPHPQPHPPPLRRRRRITGDVPARRLIGGQRSVHRPSSALPADGGPARVPRAADADRGRRRSRDTTRGGAQPPRACRARRPPSPTPGGCGTARTPDSCDRRSPGAPSSVRSVSGASGPRGTWRRLMTVAGACCSVTSQCARFAATRRPCISASGTVWQVAHGILLDGRRAGEDGEARPVRVALTTSTRAAPGEEGLGAEPRVRVRRLRALGDVTAPRASRPAPWHAAQDRAIASQSAASLTGRLRLRAARTPSPARAPRAWHWRQFTRSGCDRPDLVDGAGPGVARQAVLPHLERVRDGRRAPGHAPRDRSRRRRHGAPTRSPGTRRSCRSRHVALAAARELGVRDHGRVGLEPRRPAAVARGRRGRPCRRPRPSST